MQKPTGYDEAQVSGEFTPVELGGHCAVIKQVSERDSSTGKPMIVVLFDFILPDKQAGYFTSQFDADTREPKKWPYNGSMYIMVNDYNDPKKTSRQFKTFCSCAERSNDFQIKWGGSSWAQQFKGKKIGVVYGEVENEYDGKITMRHQPRWFCTWDAAPGAKIPATKYLNGVGPAKPVNKPEEVEDGFLNIPTEVDEDEIPF